MPENRHVSGEEVRHRKHSASRRRVLKALTVGGGAVVASRSVPETWVPPSVGRASTAVHAQTLPDFECSMDLEGDGSVDPGTVSGPGPHEIHTTTIDELFFDIEADLGNGSNTAVVDVTITPNVDGSDNDGSLDLNADGSTADGGAVSFDGDWQHGGDAEDAPSGDWLQGITVELESEGFAPCVIELFLNRQEPPA